MVEGSMTSLLFVSFWDTKRPLDVEEGVTARLRLGTGPLRSVLPGVTRVTVDPFSN